MSDEKEIIKQEQSESIYSKIYSFFLLEDLQKDDVKSKKLYLISKEDIKKFYDCIKYDSLKELKANKEKEFNLKSIEDYYKENKVDLKPLDKDIKIKIKEKTEEKEGNEKMEVISEIVVEILQSIGYEIEIIKKEAQSKQDEIKDTKTEQNKEATQEQAKSEAKEVNKTEEQTNQKKGEEKKDENEKKDEEKGDKMNKEEDKEKEKINEKLEDIAKKGGEESTNIEKGDKKKKAEEEKLNKGKEEPTKVEEEKPKENKEEIKKEGENNLTNEKLNKKPEEENNNPPHTEEVKQQNDDNKPIEDKKEGEKKEIQSNNEQIIPQETNPKQNDKVESPANENSDPPKQENNPPKHEKKDEDKQEPPKPEEKEQKPEKVGVNTDPKHEQPKEADTLNIDENKEEENKNIIDETSDNKECDKEKIIDKEIIDKESNNKDKTLLCRKVNRGKDGEQNEQETTTKKNKIEGQPKQDEEKNEIKKEKNEIKEEKNEIKEEKNEIQNPNEIPKEKDNNNENDIVNQLTPEQMLFIQQQLQMQEMQRQMMIQKYFLDNGWENNFINNYLLNIPAENKELDDGLPYAKNGIIQLDSDKPTLGLQNVGATCYMNATLECLIHMKELSQLLLSAFFFKYPRENKEYAEKHKLTLNYINLLSQVFFPKLNGNQSKYYAPYEFKAIISELNPLFQGVQANDAKDLLQCILENLHNELKMATQYFQEYNIDQRDEKASMQYFFNSYITQNKSPVQDFLYGINRIKSICLKCNTAKYNFQTYNLLYFPLKEAKRIAVLRKKKEDEKFDEKNYTLNLEDCFAHSEQVDHFTGDNQMYCNECQSCADAEYQTVLYTTPTILSIVLNRGKANLDFQEKFEFGLDLDIKKYIYNPEAKHGKYYLIGMVVHSGEHGMGGHFIAYCRMDKKAKWFCYNDAWVTECNDIEKKLSENSPYILFYHYDNDFNNDNK